MNDMQKGFVESARNRSWNIGLYYRYGDMDENHGQYKNRVLHREWVKKVKKKLDKTK